MTKENLEIMYDHYKDTCSEIKTSIKRRDSLVFIVGLILVFFAFNSFYPSSTYHALNQFINYKFGITLDVNFSVIGNMVWFGLSIFVIRYFQVAVYVERQYTYIHKIENKLNDFMGASLITREGKGYLEKYPIFSNWVWLIYTIFLPVILLIIVVIKIINEWLTSYYCVNGNLLLNTVFAVILAVSIVLYLHMVHCGDKK